MRVAYYPRVSSANIYPRLVAALISECAEVRMVSPKSAADMLWILRRPDVAVINWLENMCVSKGRLSIHGLIFSLMWFAYLRLFCNHVVFVHHNVRSHSAVGVAAKVSAAVASFIERCSSISVTHSRTDSGYSRLYVPHPLYPTTGMEWKRSSEPYFVYFGGISRWKGLTELVTAWPDDLKLIIAGECSDEPYLHQLRVISGRGVSIRARYQSDVDAEKLLGEAVGVVLPNTGGAAIVSGSFMYAISHKKKVIAIKSEFLSNLAAKYPDEGLMLADTVTTFPELARQLVSSEFDGSQLGELEFSDRKIRQAIELAAIELGLSVRSL